MRVVEKFAVVIEGRGLNGPEKDRYEAVIQGMINGLGATQVGKILLHWVKYSGTHRDWVLINPFTRDYYAKYGSCNALAWDDLWPVQIGTTEVMATKVNFSPEKLMKSPCDADPGSTPMETLIHELVHAQRSLARVMKTVKLEGAMKGWENEEEFFAIIFTNVFSSAHAVTSVVAHGLRGDHAAAVLPGAQTDSAVFLANRDNYRLVKKYCEQQSKLTEAMAAVQVKFNPFRTYYDWKARNKSVA